MPKNSYNSILKSTSILGGVQVFSIFTKILNAKFIAVLLGPTGVGILGLLQSTLQMVSSLFGMGIGISAVREVAQANAQKDTLSIGKTIAVLKTWVWLSGTIGALFLFIFSRQISLWTFDNDTYSLHFKILSTAILLAQLTQGNLAILQGTRRIKQLAKSSILGSVLGLCFSIPLYYFFEQSGIVPAILIQLSINYFFAYFFTREIKLEKPSLLFKTKITEGVPMIKLGMALMIGGLLMPLAIYFFRVHISRTIGLADVGYFQVAWGISFIYADMVFSAMSKDYYPRLSEAYPNKTRINQLVNEQLHITLLIILPIAGFVMLTSNMLVSLLYSSQFSKAVPLLQWLIFGTLFKAVNWPMGFVQLAAGKKQIFLLTQILFIGTFVLAAVYFLNAFGLKGIGIGYLLSTVSYSFIIYFVTRYISSFRFDVFSIKIISLSIPAFILLFLLNSLWAESLIQMIAVWIIWLITSLFCVYHFNRIVPIRELFQKIRNKLSL